MCPKGHTITPKLNFCPKCCQKCSIKFNLIISNVWCQIVLVPNCPVPNCPGAKLSWCQIVRCQIVRCQIVLPPYQHQYHRQHPTSAELPVPTFCTKKMYFLLDPSKREESPRKFCCFCKFVYLPLITSVEFYGSSKESKYS